MYYMCSESEEKSGFDPSDIICVYVFILMLVPVPTKILYLYSPDQKIIITNTEIQI